MFECLLGVKGSVGARNKEVKIQEEEAEGQAGGGASPLRGVSLSA